MVYLLLVSLNLGFFIWSHQRQPGRTGFQFCLLLPHGSLSDRLPAFSQIP